MAEFRLDAVASSLFLHGGLMHLVGNMLFLYIYADNIEHYFGHMQFLAVYLFGGAASCVIYGLWAADPSVPLIGASGRHQRCFGAVLDLVSRAPHQVLRGLVSVLRRAPSDQRTLGFVVLRGR